MGSYRSVLIQASCEEQHSNWKNEVIFHYHCLSSNLFDFSVSPRMCSQWTNIPKWGQFFLMIAIHALVWMEILNVLKYFVFHLIIHVFTKEKHIKMASVSKLDAIHAGAEEERLEDVSKNFVEDVIQTLIAQLAIIDHFHSTDQNLQIKSPF